jgi:hypothetical protein
MDSWEKITCLTFVELWHYAEARNKEECRELGSVKKEG